MPRWVAWRTRSSLRRAATRGCSMCPPAARALVNPRPLMLALGLHFTTHSRELDAAGPRHCERLNYRAAQQVARQTTMSTTYTLCLESSQTQKTPQSWEAASPVGVHKEMHHGPSFGKWRRNDLFVNTGAACMDEWAEACTPISRPTASPSTWHR